jgi:hypothetical protein
MPGLGAFTCGLVTSGLDAAVLRLRGTLETTAFFLAAIDFRFGLEALTAERLVLAAELLFTLVLATFFFAELLAVICFRLGPAFLIFTVFFAFLFAFLAIVSSKVQGSERYHVRELTSPDNLHGSEKEEPTLLFFALILP